MNQRHAMVVIGLSGIVLGLVVVALGVDILRHLDDPEPPGSLDLTEDPTPAAD